MAQATLFKNNKNQAIRLPKSLEFPKSVKRVEVINLGEGLLITTTNHIWDDWFAQETASGDFMQVRDQGEIQKREEF